MTANERRLAKLLREADALMFDYIDAEDAKIIAAYLAKRGVLAVCAKTVTTDDEASLALMYPRYVRPTLRRLARGVR